MNPPPAPRVVLDTNAVVSALLFPSGRIAWIRTTWQAAGFIPLADRDTVAELIRVLAYPKFRLTPSDRDSLLADYLPFVETVAAGAGAVDLPDLRDPDDRMFVDLARRAAADALVTGDADILAVQGRLGGTDIVRPGEFEAWLRARNTS